MAKLAYVQNNAKAPGVKVGVLFKVDKVNGYSLKFNSQVYKDGKWADAEGKMMDIQFGESMLILPNERKRTGDNPSTGKPYRDPDFNVLAYPDAEVAKTETKNETTDAEAKEGEEEAR